MRMIFIYFTLLRISTLRVEMCWQIIDQGSRPRCSLMEIKDCIGELKQFAAAKVDFKRPRNLNTWWSQLKAKAIFETCYSILPLDQAPWGQGEGPVKAGARRVANQHQLRQVKMESPDQQLPRHDAECLCLIHECSIQEKGLRFKQLKDFTSSNLPPLNFFLQRFATFLQPPNPPTFLQTPYTFTLNPKP